MAYRVLDNGMNADYSGSCSRMDKSGPWHTSKFDKLEDAITYALDYLGDYGITLRQLKRYEVEQLLKLGYEYSYAADKIQIKEVP